MNAIIESKNSSAATLPSPAVVADFNQSIPPTLPIFTMRLSEGLISIASDQSRLVEIAHAVAGGSERSRAAAASWVSPRFGEPVSPDRVLVTNGTQGALLLLIERFVGQGGLLLAEELTYTPLPSLARRAHVELRGLPLDEEGIIPENFAEICRLERPRALYCNPTIHNPTTRTMSETRRAAIANIARDHDVMIIEDDPLGLLHPEAPRPISAIAPDDCWYVMGSTKSLAHGLRFAALVGPTPDAVKHLVEPIRGLSHWFPSPLPTVIMTNWIEAGVADEIRAAIHAEILVRNRIAKSILREFSVESPPDGMHLWVSLPSERDRYQLVSDLANQGVLIRQADVFAIEGANVPNAIRISLGGPSSADVVAQGIRQIAISI